MEGKEIVRRPGALAEWLAALLFTGLSTTADARPGAGSDQFLVVEHPERLLVLNGYQQNLSPQDLLVLQSYAPMRILKERDLLGDGFTPCTRVEIAGAQYFLIRDTDGRLSGEARAGILRTFSGSTLRRDTVHVLESAVLEFLSLSGGEGKLLRAGERLVRIFSSGDRICVQCPGRSPAYGWVTLTPAAEDRQWSLTHAAEATESMVPGGLRDSVQAALTRTNAVLASLYRFFNERIGENRQSPHWQFEVSQLSIVCTLLGASPGRDFPESTRYLMNDLQNYVLGTNFGVFQVAGGIEIRSK
jgi:hypothetical protein